MRRRKGRVDCPGCPEGRSWAVASSFTLAKHMRTCGRPEKCPYLPDTPSPRLATNQSGDNICPFNSLLFALLTSPWFAKELLRNVAAWLDNIGVLRARLPGNPGILVAAYAWAGPVALILVHILERMDRSTETGPVDTGPLLNDLAGSHLNQQENFVREQKDVQDIWGILRGVMPHLLPFVGTNNLSTQICGKGHQHVISNRLETHSTDDRRNPFAGFQLPQQAAPSPAQLPDRKCPHCHTTGVVMTTTLPELSQTTFVNVNCVMTCIDDSGILSAVPNGAKNELPIQFPDEMNTDQGIFKVASTITHHGDTAVNGHFTAANVHGIADDANSRQRAAAGSTAAVILVQVPPPANPTGEETENALKKVRQIRDLIQPFWNKPVSEMAEVANDNAQSGDAANEGWCKGKRRSPRTRP
jgi:hypothetical protein